jgi:methionyl aminopeptidase
LKDEIRDNYTEAGTLASAILKKGRGMVTVGASLLDVVEGIEQMVVDEGAGLAFPLNVSFNEAAAHDTASTGDERIFAAGDLIKLDLGVHLDGYIADTAITVDLGDHADLVSASEQALAEAIRAVRPGVTTGELGGIIQQTIEAKGFKPIANLTGHGLGQFQIHTQPSIPNIRLIGGTPLVEGMVIAIEPFATTGSGRVSDERRIEILQQIGNHPVRMPAARRVLEDISDRNGMPFARRWITDSKRELALNALIRAGVCYGYPVLHDQPGSMVSQHEHTLIVTEEGSFVTTA